MTGVTKSGYVKKHNWKFDEEDEIYKHLHLDKNFRGQGTRTQLIQKLENVN